MKLVRPDLVHEDKAAGESGEDMNRLKDIQNIYTGIRWYAKYPNHYAGDGSKPNVEIGKLLIESRVKQLVKLIETLKENDKILELQDQFYKDVEELFKTR